jgi:transcriptional regulator with XRE-family HTH domain
MEQKKINRVALANRLQVTPPAITKLLRGSSNFTLKKLLSIADALEMDLKIDFEDKNFSHYQIILKSGSICGLSDQKPVGSVSGGHIFVTSSTSPIPVLEIKDLERIEHEPRISQAA